MQTFLSSKCTFRNATKIVELRMKYINRTLVIARVALHMFRFNVIVVIMPIYDVEIVHFDQKRHRQNFFDGGM